jgi:hypothetical protein
VAAARGETGAVRDIPAARVKELLAAALRYLRSFNQHKGVATMTRERLRTWFEGREGVDAEAASALEHAFFRAVDPKPFGHGVFLIPAHAELLVEHREWRFPAGRLGLDDVLFIVQAVAAAKERMEHVPATLLAFSDRAGKAVRSLGIDPESA